MRPRATSVLLGVLLTVGVSGPVLLVATAAAAVEECAPVGEAQPIAYGYDPVETNDYPPGFVIQEGTVGWSQNYHCEDVEAGTNRDYSETTTAPQNGQVAVAPPTPTPTPSNPGTPVTPGSNGSNPRPTPTPTEAAVLVPTPQPTATREATDLQLDPIYYDTPQDPARENLLATGALAGAIITACVVIVGAILYRRFFRDRVRYRSR